MIFTHKSSSYLAQQPLSIKACLPLVGLPFSDLLISLHSRIVSPTYGGTVHSGLEPMTGMFFVRVDDCTIRPVNIDAHKYIDYLIEGCQLQATKNYTSILTITIVFEVPKFVTMEKTPYCNPSVIILSHAVKTSTCKPRYLDWWLLTMAAYLPRYHQ